MSRNDALDDPTDASRTTADGEPSAAAAMDGDAAETAREDAGPEELRLQVELLREENERLRRSYALARRSSYRRTALGTAAVGAVAAAGGLLFPPASDVLFALGGTGLFAAVLTYYLTPERFVAADVGSAVYGAMADTEAAVADELGLADRTVYVPAAGPDPAAWLFVPQHEEYDVPDADALASPFVATGRERERGVSFRPTGAPLVRELDEGPAGGTGDDPVATVERLGEALAEQFELVDHVSVDAAPDERRATVGVDDSAFGAVDRFDHPVQSVLAVGLARATDAPVAAETLPAENERSAYLVTLRWGERGGD